MLISFYYSDNVRKAEDWWSTVFEKNTEKSQAVEDKEEDLAKLLSQTHVGKGKQLAHKSSRSSALTSEQVLVF